MITYEGIVSGKKTRITFFTDAVEAEKKLLKFCAKFNADVESFKLVNESKQKVK